MKKILLIGALAVASLTFAANQTKLDPSQVKGKFVQAPQKIEVEAGPFNWKDLGTILDEHRIQRAKAAAQYDEVDWYYAPGTFHLGVKPGFGFYSMGFIIVPYLDSVEYTNIFGATNWYANDSLVLADSPKYSTHYGIYPEGYVADVPVTGDHDFVTKTQTYKIKGTSYGIGTSYQYVIPAYSGHTEWWGGDNLPMTLCGMRNDTLFGGSDLYQVGGKQTADPYQDGCGIHLDSLDRVATADTMGIIVDNLALMKIESIIMPIWHSEKVDTFTTYLPNSTNIKLEIFQVTDQGIDFSAPIAETTVSNQDFIASSGGQDYGTLIATFKDVDILGNITEVPIWVDGNFFIQITNYNESGCDFGYFSDFYNHATATTIYKYKGQWSYRYSRGYGEEYGQNLAISFDAYFPTLANDTTEYTMNADIAGGATYYGNDPEDNWIMFWSNVNPEDWSLDTEADWLSFGMDDSYYETYRAVFIQIEAEELPEGVTGRTATVEFNADGAVQTFTIIQGEGQGIQTVKNDRFDNKSYDVLGREIKDVNFKGVVIRNGEKYLK